MRPDSVVMPTPLPSDDLGFLERVENLAIQKFIPEFAVEALAVAVFPRAARHDVGRLRAHPSERVT